MLNRHTERRKLPVEQTGAELPADPRTLAAGWRDVKAAAEAGDHAAKRRPTQQLAAGAAAFFFERRSEDRRQPRKIRHPAMVRCSDDRPTAVPPADESERSRAADRLHRLYRAREHRPTVMQQDDRRIQDGSGRAGDPRPPPRRLESTPAEGIERAPGSSVAVAK